MRIRRDDPRSLRSVTRSYKAYGRYLQYQASRRGLGRTDLLTYNPLHAAFGDHDGFRSVTYFARDNWAAHHAYRRLSALYATAAEAIRARGLKVAAVSQEIIDAIQPTRESAIIPNGVDPIMWLEPESKEDPYGGLSRPIALYTGTIDQRLSSSALSEIAGVVGSVVLLGPAGDDTGVRLSRYIPNLHVMSSVGPNELVTAVVNADVCVVPHVVSPLTMAMSPLKVYEYLAGGRPVVATDLGPIRNIHPSIRLAMEGSFGDACLAALQAGPLSEDARQSFIDDNKWSRRCERLLDLVFL